MRLTIAESGPNNRVHFSMVHVGNVPDHLPQREKLRVRRR